MFIVDPEYYVDSEPSVVVIGTRFSVGEMEDFDVMFHGSILSRVRFKLGHVARIISASLYGVDSSIIKKGP